VRLRRANQANQANQVAATIAAVAATIAGVATTIAGVATTIGVVAGTSPGATIQVAEIEAITAAAADLIADRLAITVQRPCAAARTATVVITAEIAPSIVHPAAFALRTVDVTEVRTKIAAVTKAATRARIRIATKTKIEVVIEAAIEIAIKIA
jgi:hypothetical protein